jgi:putative DNA modification/repair radical SAM protein
VNRVSSDTPRARFTPQEVVTLTIEFYKRNYIEGLFLSSGVIQSPDYTMEELVEVARSLRVDHAFGGYIHLKAVPGASRELLLQAGRWSDRLSANIELPTQTDLDRLAPAKSHTEIETSMGQIREGLLEAKEARQTYATGQSTQMVVGATETSDATILTTASHLYSAYGLRRVYYSGFSPIPHADGRLPVDRAPLVREHRLYQADWLMRFYGFDSQELTQPGQPNLALDRDPKLSWALRNRDRFPVDVNTAAEPDLLRVPGFGVRNVKRMMKIRRYARLRLADLAQLRVPLSKARPFIVTADQNPAVMRLDTVSLPGSFRQMSLFDSTIAAVTGEV